MLIQPSQSFAAESGEWVKKRDMLAPRTGSAVATLNGQIYVFGGSSDGKTAYEGIKRNNTYVYDPASDTWSEKKQMPTARAGATTAVVNNKIYVIGGYFDHNGKVERTNKVEIYDPQADSWTSTAMPTPRSWASAVAIGDKIFVFGGGNNSGALSLTECYDTTTNTWTRKSNMPMPSNGIVSAEVGGKIYVFGGWDFSTSANYIFTYSPDEDLWTQKKQSSIARNATSIAAVDGKIYLLGGSTDGKSTGAMSNVEIYDPVANTINKFDDLTFPRTQAVSAVINNNIYIIGGTSNNKILNTVEMYSFENKEEPEPQEPDPQEPEQPKGDRAILVVTMTTGLEKEFDLSMDEVNAFISWYENKQAGTGTASYAIDKHNNNKGPFSSRKDYVIYDKILTFEVNEYSLR